MKSRAFTLIELLIVIGIIAFLIAIVIPVLGFTRQYARAIDCSSKIRNLVINLKDYDFKNETFPSSFNQKINTPPPGGYAGNMTFDRPGWWWFNYVTDYSRNKINSDSALSCPSRKIKENMFKRSILVGNYGVNQSICKSQPKTEEQQTEFIGSSLCSTDVPSPSRTLLIVDSGYSIINWYHVTDSPPKVLSRKMEDCSYLPGLSLNEDRALLPEELKNDALNGRHVRKTVNAGFVDGHVSREKADDLSVEKVDNGYKNLTPLWKPK